MKNKMTPWNNLFLVQDELFIHVLKKQQVELWTKRGVRDHTTASVSMKRSREFLSFTYVLKDMRVELQWSPLEKPLGALDKESKNFNRGSEPELNVDWTETGLAQAPRTSKHFNRGRRLCGSDYSTNRTFYSLTIHDKSGQSDLWKKDVADVDLVSCTRLRTFSPPRLPIKLYHSQRVLHISTMTSLPQCHGRHPR